MQLEMQLEIHSPKSPAAEAPLLCLAMVFVTAFAPGCASLGGAMKAFTDECRSQFRPGRMMFPFSIPNFFRTKLGLTEGIGSDLLS
jgi:hypothetical protein